MTFTRRALGAIARRLGRPELVSAFYAGARREEQERIGIAAVLAATLPRDGCYVDVGTNRGQVLREAVRLAPAGRHVAFEPIPELAEELAREFPGVDCRQVAVGARREQTRFCHFRSLDGWSGLLRNPGISDEQGAPEYIDVQVSTLDEELAGLAPALVKIDVEGAELAVLQGARDLLAGARPLLIFEHVAAATALYGDAPEGIWDLLTDAGYRIMTVTGEGPFDRGAFARGGDVVNWLGVPEG